MRSRQIIRKTVLWLAGTAFVAAIVGPIGEFFIRVADDKGWYLHAGTRWDGMMAATLAFLSSHPFQLVTALLVGLAGGFSADSFFRKRETTRQSDATLPVALSRDESDLLPDWSVTELFQALCQVHPMPDNVERGRYHTQALLFEIADAIVLHKLVLWGRYGRRAVEQIQRDEIANGAFELDQGLVVLNVGPDVYRYLMLNRAQAEIRFFDQVTLEGAKP